MAGKVHTDSEALYAVRSAITKFAGSFQEAQGTFSQCFEQMNYQVEDHIRKLDSDIESCEEEKRVLQRQVEECEEKQSTAQREQSQHQNGRTDSFVCDRCGTRMMLKVYGDSTTCKSSSGCSGTMHRFFNDGEYHRLNVEIQQLEDKKKRLQEIIADLEKRIVLQRKARADTAQNYSDLQMHQQSIMSLLVFGSGEDPETAVAFIDKALVSLGDYQAVGFDVDGEAQKKTVDDSESNADKSAGKRLTPEEVNDRWKQVVESIDEQIENYKEALMNRGVPECSWLKKTLAKHRAKMLEQEGYNLDVASGHSHDSTNSANAYTYPSDYTSFYDEMAGEFRSYCLSGTNPRYSDGPEWHNNCQRCVPTYELRRRGVDATVYPSTHGSDHLSHYPFDVWKSPTVFTGSGDGRSDIEREMSLWGDGARAQIVVIWDDGFGVNGHTFVAEQRDGHTYYYDPQTDTEDAASYFEDVIHGRTRFCRIDNLNTSNYINDCYEQEVA